MANVKIYPQKEMMNIKESFLKKAARLLIRLKISQLFRIKQKDFSLRFYPSSMSRVLWVDQFLSGASYLEGEQFFRRYLLQGDVVVDVGANIGFFTLLSSVLAGKDGRVYSIEPHPRIYEYLQGNLTLNKAENVCSFNVAMGNKNGIVRFSDRKSDDANSVAIEDYGIKVPLRKLDELGIEDASISLLKIDVEGYEKFVIEGGEHTLRKVQCVYFESIERNCLTYGYGIADLLQLLINQGFKILAIEGNRVRSIVPELCPESWKNLVAV